MSKEPKQESVERNIRRHEVSFSKIQGNHSSEYVDNYLYHHGQFEEQIDWWNEEFESKVIYRTIQKLPESDRPIITDYMTGTKQKDIAEKLGISPSAVSQRIDKILYNYRVLLANDPDFKKTKRFKMLKWESKTAFRKYIEEIRKSGKFKIDLNQVQEFIQDVRKALRHTLEIGADRNIKEKINKQISYANLDEKWIENTNKAFAELGIEAHFEKLKTFKGNIMQILKMVDDFIDELKEKALK